VNFVWVFAFSSLSQLLDELRIIISYDDDDIKEDDEEEEVVSRRRKRRKARVNTRRTHQSKEKEEEYVDSTGVTKIKMDIKLVLIVIVNI
jgi:hypothetical protein